jgi:hypothetical protein
MEKLMTNLLNKLKSFLFTVWKLLILPFRVAAVILFILMFFVALTLGCIRRLDLSPFRNLGKLKEVVNGASVTIKVTE